MRKRLTVIIFLALTSSVALFVQEHTSLGQRAPTRYLQDVWTTEKGLPQNDVTQIIQTRDGYLWLGTNGGLVRFDGILFTVFDTGNTPELRSNRILALSEDRDGALWLGTQNGGLTKYYQGKFKTYTTKDGLPDESIFDIEPDSNGNLWLSPGGLVRMTGEHFTRYTTRDGLPSNGSGYLTAAPDGSLWFISGGWLMHFQNGRFERYLSVKGLPDDWIHQVSSSVVAKDGSVWLATRYGLVRFQNGSLTAITKNSTPSGPTTPSMLVVHTFKDHEGNVRFITTDGIAHYEGGKIILDSRIPELKGQGLEQWIIRTCLEDREGNLWLGLGGLGLQRFRLRQVVAYTAETGLSDQGFTPITEDAAGGLWLGSVQGPRSLFYFRDGKFTGYDINVRVRSLCRDHTGKLWIGTEEGLYHLQNTVLVPNQLLNPVLGQNTLVQGIYEDKEGDLWVGTGRDEEQDGALYRLKNGVVTKYQMSEGLVANDVRFIMEDHQGTLWIGTTRGMSSFKDQRFTNYTTEQGLSNNNVRDIYEDSDQTLWVGTYGGGLNRLKNGRLISINTKNGMFDNVVSRILEDSQNNFWMSGNRGIFRVNRKELNDFADGRLPSVNSIFYGVADGMKTSETNGGSQPAGWKSSDGRLWFPTIRGAVVIDPNNLNRLPPPVYIEQILIGQTPAAPGAPVEVRPGQGDLEIHYTGLSYTAPEKVRFKYKLEGYDQDWVDAKERRVAYYTQVTPGAYTFRVMAANNDGVWSTQDAVIQITVVPPVWRTWWFRALAILGVLAGIFLLYKQRIRELERRRRTQEDFSQQLIASQESERKRIAGELHDSLSQNLVVIKNRAWLSLQEPANHQSVLEQMEEIADAADQSLTEVREIAYNLRPFQIDRLGLTAAVESLVAKVDTPDLRFVAESDNIDSLLLPEMEINLYRIVQEGINNIIKHSAATKALIKIKRGQSLIEVTIEDNGRGFDQHDQRPESGNGSGFGLIGLTERARILGCVPVIDSIAGKGTRIYLRIVTTTAARAAAPEAGVKP